MTGQRSFDLGLLQLFCTLWDTRSVTRTAVLLELSQSSVSAALGRLRAVFDDRLFIWDGHRMIPTPRAVEAIDEVRRVVEAVDLLIAPDAPLAGHFRRHFVIASADYLAALAGPTLIDRCAREAPGLVCEFVDVKPDMLNKGAGAGIDFFLMPSSRLQTAGLEATPIYTDRYVCVGRGNNAALDVAAVDAAAFMALPHIGYTSVQRAIFSHEANVWTAEQHPDYRMLGPHYLAFALIAARSQAVAIVPQQVTRLLEGIAHLKIIEPPMAMPSIEITLFGSSARQRDPACHWLHKALIEACHQGRAL